MSFSSAENQPSTEHSAGGQKTATKKTAKKRTWKRSASTDKTTKTTYKKRTFSNSRKKQSRTANRPDKAVKETKEKIEPVNQELELARSLNRLPAVGAVRALKFPGLDTALAKQQLIKEIERSFVQCGKQKIVFPLSGGLDSAVTAGLMAEAIGSKQMIPVHFLESDRPALDKGRADLVAKYLGMPLKIRDCRSQAEHHIKLLSGADQRIRASILARERMIATQALADVESAVVMTGINKTKWMLGYGVQYGDMTGQFNPLGDIYRTQVIELARAINVPRVILDYTERFAVLPNMTVNDENAITWKEADFYLHQMLDARLSLAYIMSLGVDEEKVKRIYQLIRASAFKRKMTGIPLMTNAYHPRSGDTL